MNYTIYIRFFQQNTLFTMILTPPPPPLYFGSLASGMVVHILVGLQNHYWLPEIITDLDTTLLWNKSNTTRSTPRAQTSATPSLKSVKQSTPAWNSVAYCFCPYPENFMNVHPSGIPWCCQQTRTQKIKKRDPLPKGLNRSSPKCSRLSLVS